MKYLSTKNLAIFLGLATIAFAIATIVLAVQKADIQSELNEALDKLNSQESSSSTTTSVTPTSTLTPTSSSTSTSTIFSTPSSNQTNPTDVPWQSSTPSNQTDPTDVPSSNSTVTTTPVTPNSTSTTEHPNFPNPNDIIYRLPNHVRPWQYKLYLHPDLQSKVYQGYVSIGLSIDSPTNLIVLHSKDLDIYGISILEVMSKMRIKIKSYYTDPVRELLLIEFDEILQLYVPYTLSISFRGSLHGLSGFYSSSYTNHHGEQM